jgi:hypothetical protein
MAWQGKITEIWIQLTLHSPTPTEPFMAVWIDRGEECMLEEDNDSGHSPGKKMSAVKSWKPKKDLKYYFNPPSSPDMSLIESVPRILKQRMSADNFFDYDSLKERIL